MLIEDQSSIVFRGGGGCSVLHSHHTARHSQIRGDDALNMSVGRYRVLHIGGNTTDARTIRQALTESKPERYDVEWVATLSDGLERLTTNPMSVVLLDLELPDSPVINALEKLLWAAPTIPILVVGADENEKIARQIIRAGARDYLLTTRLDSYWLPRALRHAIERKLSEEAFVAETERVEATLSSIGEALLRTDTSGRVIYLNEFAETMTGWPRDEAAGRPLEEVLQIVDGATREPAADLVRPADSGASQHSNILIRRDGSESAIEHSTAPMHDRLGLVTGATIVLRDISAARATTLRMSHLASHDPLTDLPNRLLLARSAGPCACTGPTARATAGGPLSGYRSLQTHQRLARTPAGRRSAPGRRT